MKPVRLLLDVSSLAVDREPTLGLLGRTYLREASEREGEDG